MVHSPPHGHGIAIRPADIDALGHVNNAIYLSWIQAAVLGHWHAHALPEAVAAFRWVAVKQEIIYRKPAFLGDALVATVVLERVRRESAYYDTFIRRGSELIADAKSRWCCVDAATLRPGGFPRTWCRHSSSSRTGHRRTPKYPLAGTSMEGSDRMSARAIESRA